VGSKPGSRLRCPPLELDLAPDDDEDDLDDDDEDEEKDDEADDEG